MIENLTDYHKAYYEKNKSRMIKQMKVTQRNARIKGIIEKLNKNEYKRTPRSKIEQYNIKYDENTKKYHIDQ